MPNYKPLYADTDSVKQDEDCKNDVLTKHILNSFYGLRSEKYMNRDYISVIVDGAPTVIFKRNIIAVAVSKNDTETEIMCVSGLSFFTKEDYASVVKKIIN